MAIRFASTRVPQSNPPRVVQQQRIAKAKEAVRDITAPAGVAGDITKRGRGSAGVLVRLTADELVKLDTLAEKMRVSRPEALRRILQRT